MRASGRHGVPESPLLGGVQRGRHDRGPQEVAGRTDWHAPRQDPHPEVVHRVQGPHHLGRLRGALAADSCVEVASAARLLVTRADSRRHGSRAVLQLMLRSLPTDPCTVQVRPRSPRPIARM
eukprot:scaffold336_cov384-Prasinococcus_capsulatus_cf.AAC.20